MRQDLTERKVLHTRPAGLYALARMAPRDPTRPVPALVPDEGAPASSTSRGALTRAHEISLDAARAVRDSVVESELETPADGVAAVDNEGAKEKPRKPRRSRPSWPAVITAALLSAFAGDPVWEQFRGWFGADDATRTATELGELRGHITALEARVNSSEALELKSAADRAVEWREIDGKIVVLGENIETALASLGVAASARKPLPATSQDTLERHSEAERAWRDAKRRAEKKQVEQSIADSGTVIGQ